MNKTDEMLNKIPSVVTRNNKCYNLIITKTGQGDAAHIRVGYQHVAKNGKAEVLTVVDAKSKGTGFRDALWDLIINMMTSGWIAMGYEVKK